MKYEDTKQRLILEGSRLMSYKGYNGVGIKEILDAVQVPKGSFYHYFKSKEDFAIAIIQYNFDLREEAMNHYLSDTGKSPLSRIKDFLGDLMKRYAASSFDDDCLLMKMVSEMANLSKPIRDILEEGTGRVKSILRSCLKEAQEAREIDGGHQLDKLTEYIYLGWEGAIIRSRLLKSAEPAKIFCEYLFEKILP